MNLTLICYREDGADIFHGCEMGRSGSAFEVYRPKTEQEAAEFLAAKWVENVTSERWVCNWDVHILIDGRHVDFDYGEYDAADYEIRERIKAMAEPIYTSRKAEHDAKKQKEREANEQRVRDQQEEAERKVLAALQAKYRSAP